MRRSGIERLIDKIKQTPIGSEIKPENFTSEHRPLMAAKYFVKKGYTVGNILALAEVEHGFDTRKENGLYLLFAADPRIALEILDDNHFKITKLDAESLGNKDKFKYTKEKVAGYEQVLRAYLKERDSKEFTSNDVIKALQVTDNVADSVVKYLMQLGFVEKISPPKFSAIRKFRLK